jgi:predicted transcriptional regulator
VTVRVQMDEMKRRILSFALKVERPLTTEYISEEFNLCYTTSQRILFDLAIEGYLKRLYPPRHGQGSFYLKKIGF